MKCNAFTKYFFLTLFSKSKNCFKYKNVNNRATRAASEANQRIKFRDKEMDYKRKKVVGVGGRAILRTADCRKK